MVTAKGYRRLDVIEQTFNVNGLQLAAKVWGSKLGTPVLALHGWLDNAATFDLLAPQMSNCFIVAVDFPGHGKSDHLPVTAHYHFWGYVMDMLAIAEQLGWGKFVVLGHSMGATVAAYMAALAPDRIQQLILLEGLGAQSMPELDMLPHVKNLLAQVRDLNNKQMPIYSSTEAAIQARMNGIGQVSAAAAALLCSRGLTAKGHGYSWTTDRRLRLPSLFKLTENQVRSFLQAIVCQTLLVVGEQGLLNQFPKMKGRLGCLQNYSLKQLPGSHHLHLEAETVTAVAQAIDSFIETDHP